MFNGRTIRVQYRELHQKVFQQPQTTTRNPTSMVPKLAPVPPTSESRPSTRASQQQSQPHLRTLHKVPPTLGQLSGNGGLSSDAVSGFGGFDPVTGLANGVVPTPPSTSIYVRF